MSQQASTRQLLDVRRARGLFLFACAMFVAIGLVAVWFTNGAGLTMTVKYGSRDLEIQKGKKALALGDLPSVVEVVKVLVEATRGGEFDGAMEAAIAAGKSKAARS